MTKESNWLSRRRLLSSLVVIGGASAAAGGGTMAAVYSDRGSSRNNTIESDSLDLTFGEGDSTLNLAATLNSGETTTGSVELENAEPATGSLDVQVDYANSDTSGNKYNAGDIADVLTVTTLDYGTTDLLSATSLPDPCTLADLEANSSGSPEAPDDLRNLADPGNGTPFTITLELGDVNQANGQYGGEGIEVWFTFILNQTDSQ